MLTDCSLSSSIIAKLQIEESSTVALIVYRSFHDDRQLDVSDKPDKRINMKISQHA